MQTKVFWHSDQVIGIVCDSHERPYTLNVIGYDGDSLCASFSDFTRHVWHTCPVLDTPGLGQDWTLSLWYATLRQNKPGVRSYYYKKGLQLYDTVVLNWRTSL